MASPELGALLFWRVVGGQKVVLFPKFLKEVLLVSAATASLSVAVADGVNTDWYHAFDHHPAKDHETISFLMKYHFGRREVKPQDLTLKPAVDAAYQANCIGEEGEIRSQCFDLVNFMLVPAIPMKTEFGKKLVDILENRNFDSPEGLALQQALGIDSQSLERTNLFYKSLHDTYYLPFLRFYAIDPPDEEFDSEASEVLKGTEQKRLLDERYTSFKVLALAHKRLAFSEISYAEYFRAYRRYFQARYMHQEIQNLIPRLRANQASLDRLGKVREGSEEVLDEQIRLLKEARAKLIASATWIRERLNAYFPIMNKWIQFKAKRYEYNEQDIAELENLRQLDQAGLLGHLENQPKSSFALLLLYEHGFQMLPLQPNELAEYELKASLLRAENKWGNVGLSYLYNMIRQMDLAVLSPKTSPKIPEKMMHSPLPKNPDDSMKKL